MSKPAATSSLRKLSYARAMASLAAGMADSPLFMGQQHGGIQLDDTVVIDHQGRSISIAQLPGQAVFRVIAIAGDPADQQRPADDIDDELRAGKFEIVGAN